MSTPPLTVWIVISLKIYLPVFIIPIFLPFDGNNPRSVILMDNASIHRLEHVEEIITGVAADLMPLEEDFAKIKHYLREHDSRVKLLKLLLRSI